MAIETMQPSGNAMNMMGQAMVAQKQAQTAQMKIRADRETARDNMDLQRAMFASSMDLKRQLASRADYWLKSERSERAEDRKIAQGQWDRSFASAQKMAKMNMSVAIKTAILQAQTSQSALRAVTRALAQKQGTAQGESQARGLLAERALQGFQESFGDMPTEDVYRPKDGLVPGLEAKFRKFIGKPIVRGSTSRETISEIAKGHSGQSWLQTYFPTIADDVMRGSAELSPDVYPPGSEARTEYERKRRSEWRTLQSVLRRGVSDDASRSVRIGMDSVAQMVERVYGPGGSKLPAFHEETTKQAADEVIDAVAGKDVQASIDALNSFIDDAMGDSEISSAFTRNYGPDFPTRRNAGRIKRSAGKQVAPGVFEVQGR